MMRSGAGPKSGAPFPHESKGLVARTTWEFCDHIFLSTARGDENLEEISWDEFFDEFDRKKLALLVEDRTPDGRRSNFNKIISRATVEEFMNRYRRSGRTQARRSMGERSRTGVASSSSNWRRSAAKAQATGARSHKRPARSSTGQVRAAGPLGLTAVVLCRIRAFVSESRTEF
jgi:hypothetical protein